MGAIDVHNLSKSYGKVRALDGVSFSVERDELFGLIGPDGAGKTTLFRLLTTLINPDEGSATVDGCDIKKDYLAIRKRVGYMPGRFSLYPDLSVEENLQFFAALFGVTVEESYDLIAPIYKQIEPFRTRRAGKLSGGMKQKLALSCALIHRPSVLFLDEPTTGVDAVSRSEFWDMLAGLKQMGITIIVSTPYMDEASRCDRIALIKNGKFLQVDTPDNIIAAFNKNLIAVTASGMKTLLNDIRKCNHITSAFAFGSEIHALIDDYNNISNVLSYLNTMKYRDAKIKIISPNIEDCFIWSK